MPNSVGRPRDGSIDDDILNATAAILKEKGYVGLKMDAVAAVAQVSKHTLYLRYKTPADLTVALLKQLTDTAVPIPDTGYLIDDLKLILSGIQTLLCKTPFGVVVPALIGASTGHPDLVASARLYLEERRKNMEPVILRAIARQELPSQTDPKIFLELMVAPLYYRHLISGDTIDDGYIGEIVGSALSGYKK